MTENTEPKKDHVATALDTLAEICEHPHKYNIDNTRARKDAAEEILHHYREIERMQKTPTHVTQNFYGTQQPGMTQGVTKPSGSH